jgi:hypothetical protein
MDMPRASNGWRKKQRRLATRFEKLAVNFLAMIKIAMMLWFLRKES